MTAARASTHGAAAGEHPLAHLFRDGVVPLDCATLWEAAAPARAYHWARKRAGLRDGGHGEYRDPLDGRLPVYPHDPEDRQFILGYHDYVIEYLRERSPLP